MKRVVTKCTLPLIPQHQKERERKEARCVWGGGIGGETKGTEKCLYHDWGGIYLSLFKYKSYLFVLSGGGGFACVFLRRYVTQAVFLPYSPKC